MSVGAAPRISSASFTALSWQAFERLVCRLLTIQGFTDVRLVGQTNDKGADVLGHFKGRRWLVQVKHWRGPVRVDVVDKTIEALRVYRADVPVIVALSGFDRACAEQQRRMQLEGIPVQLWDESHLKRRFATLPRFAPVLSGGLQLRDYQLESVNSILASFDSRVSRSALVVLATGLGKTTVAAETLRRLAASHRLRTLVLAHTNDLLYQLERSFWPFLSTDQVTYVWNSQERFSPVASDCDVVFASVQTAAQLAESETLPRFDLVIVDECHHAGSRTYGAVLNYLGVGSGREGAFLIGMTATPWRPDETDLTAIFGAPLVSMDLVSGMRRGFLSNVDYRMYTDNIDWTALARLPDRQLTPRQINRTLFIDEWDDAVVKELSCTWKEQPNPRAIVFCGTVDHARAMTDRINALGFCAAAAIYSSSGAHRLLPHERNLILSDFADGQIQALCAVDIFNEGIDVPDVNIIVFQRVTHSRRIFIQQLGRGLRIAEGKSQVTVLDFVSDIRRFAAGLDLKDQISAGTGPARVRLASSVEFRRAGREDPRTESFLREWLDDVAAIEDSDEDASVLRYPPPLEIR